VTRPPDPDRGAAWIDPLHAPQPETTKQQVRRINNQLRDRIAFLERENAHLRSRLAGHTDTNDQD
jgi:hypothetical protein